MKGFVSLVGAGPGDPGLLTLKARDRLKKADLIIYDYLANPEHLRQARPEAKKIGVGKGFRHKAISQNKINRLIVEFANKGKRVVRLKGGDPYLFGRGGEEALYLVRHRIPFEVVPGVTSATACAAYAGIPLTHREHNASVTFLTGHRAEDDHLDSIRWERIAKIGGTLVIYMGIYNLPKIATHLVRAGLSGKTPVAVIQWGTLPYQKSVHGRLDEIAGKVQKAQLHAPCMILIGDVVNLRSKLGWFEKLPLFGKKIVVARPADRASALSDPLKDLGAEVLELPLIQIQKIKNDPAMKEAAHTLSDYDWILFASVYSVRFFFEALKSQRLDARCLSSAQVACVGTETAHELSLHGIHSDLLPKDFGTQGLFVALKKRLGSLKNKKFFIPRSDIAPDSLELSLKKEGAKVWRVTVYQTKPARDVSPELLARIKRGEADAILFTSSSIAQNFVRVFGKNQAQKIQKKSPFLSIGPQTTKTLKSYGIRPDKEARVSTLDGLIQILRKKP